MSINRCNFFEGVLTRSVGAAPALGQAQRIAAPGGGGLCIGEAGWGTRGSCGAAWPLGDFPQLMGQRGLALRDRPLVPGRLHVGQFTYTWSKRSGQFKPQVALFTE